MTTAAPGRPCAHEHADPAARQGECRICWLSLHDPAYRDLYSRGAGGAPRRFDPCAPLPCIHRGEPTGETRPCRECVVVVDEPVYGCTLHGACTAHRLVSGLKCCRICPDRREGE